MSSALEIIVDTLYELTRPGGNTPETVANAIFLALKAAGRKIVDAEPTAAMIDAGIVERADGGTSPSEIWRAMVAAAGREG